MTETAKERIYREALENVSRSLPVNSELDLVIGEALIKAKYLPDGTDKLSVEKFQKQLNNAKKALTEIIEIPYSDNYFDEEERLSCMKEAAEKALSDWRGK
ncbi:hypothetical protein [Lactococcus lactis]|uniref:hypothetical protein n=1 Tax=Lactococcus lactis TaxID=1358 RepID=UPI000512F6D7|nr:hypothetical protein [Lactococcus lactis]KGF76749.1 hypothetical protein Llab_1263 [Lactococcus lactis]